MFGKFTLKTNLFNYKRVLSFILAFIMCLPLFSCADGMDSNNELLSSELYIDSSTNMNETADSSMNTSIDVDMDVSTDTSSDSSADISTDTSSDSSADISTDTSNDSSADISTDTSNDSSADISTDTSNDSSADISTDTSNDSSADISTDTSNDSSADISTDTSNDSSAQQVDWTTPEVTYFEDTGKCTFTTVYSPKTNDTITYENQGIYIYNTDFRMSSELENEFLELFDSFENPQSVTVREMNSEFVFSFNPSKRIACASAIKAPFSLFITKAIEQGLVPWNKKLVYEEKYDYFTGSGVIQDSFQYGEVFSVKRLYELMLYVSDNIAYLMLKDCFHGASKFNDAMNALGCGDIIDWGNWGNLTSYEMALVWREIYFYTKNGSSEAKKLYSELDRALYNELEKGIKGKENLHKSGWSANGYNDAGIFFDGDLVYSVAVMTGRKDLNDSRNVSHLIKIAKLIDKLMAEYKSYNEGQN